MKAPNLHTRTGSGLADGQDAIMRERRIADEIMPTA